jgi:hypothetical protein
MRANALLGLLVVFTALVGCQTLPQSPGPIVGDSTSLPPLMGDAEGGSWVGVPEERVPCGLECPPWTDTPAGPVGVGAPACAGNESDGRCGGRCPRAQELRRLAQQAHRFLHRRPLVTLADRCCANGCCGAVPGPEMGAVTYPYYTLRGPRDFLLANPPSIGP